MVKRAGRRIARRDEMQYIADEVLIRVVIENSMCKLDSDGIDLQLFQGPTTQYGEIISCMGSFRDHIFTGPLLQRTTLR